VTVELIHLLLLIIIANGAPIILRALMGSKLDFALDLGYRLPDREPLFGCSKTWRGVVGAFVFTPIAAILLGYSLSTGAMVAVYAVCGDLVSSFTKRRLGMAPSSMAPLLDQVPESLLPALMLKQRFNLDFHSILILVSMFVVVELVLSYILFKLGIRKRPY
jgi:CDP-2,3-bis-(O-geranylgeranyl)-sn-glycerol synthase